MLVPPTLLPKKPGSNIPPIIPVSPPLRHASGTCPIPAPRAARELVVLVGQKKVVAIAVCSRGANVGRS
jgi:hypothetical protein